MYINIFIDESGKIVTTYKLIDGATLIETQHEYDNKGRLIKDTVYRNNVLSYITEYEYDEVGQLKKKTLTDADGRVEVGVEE